MAKRKKSNDSSQQLSLFSDDFHNQLEENERENEKNNISKPNETQKDVVENKKNEFNLPKTEASEKQEFNVKKDEIQKSDLFLPFTYEEIIEEIGDKKSRLPDLIVPVTTFEEQIIQVLADIRNSGYLLFLYGVSGVGKSTFISSLQFQKHIPIQEIVPIDASELIKQNNSTSKLKELIKNIKKEASDFFFENQRENDKLCIVIDYLEHLQDEETQNVVAFFRDLNGLLRKYAILIIWPVTVREDLENMRKLARNFSSTMFHRRIPSMDFTGPPIEEYPNIAKKTIMFFNEGRSCYEFQLNDNDFEELKREYEKKPIENRLIREYLQNTKSIWEGRTDYISKVLKNVPKPTEVWFIFSYPEAEGVVARFAKQTPDIINDMWNADYKSLFAYISDHNQRKAEWKPQRLTLALSSYMLKTKIMYLPTNALISCIAAYAEDAKILIPRKEFIDEINGYKVPKHWFGKKMAQDTLKRTPLYLQLSGTLVKAGKRKSGTVEKALKNAKQAFEKINKDISVKKISDRRFNNAICLVLQDIFQNQTDFHFQHEHNHPHFTNIRPDILVDTKEKLICLEFCYTNNNTPGNLADYVLRKLNKYMKQLEENCGLPEDFSW